MGYFQICICYWGRVPSSLGEGKKKKVKWKEEIQMDFHLDDIIWIICLIDQFYLGYCVLVLLSVFQKSIYISILLMAGFYCCCEIASILYYSQGQKTYILRWTSIPDKEMPRVRLVENTEQQTCQPSLFQVVTTSFSEMEFLLSSRWFSVEILTSPYPSRLGKVL